jgi:hypothetical protein
MGYIAKSLVAAFETNIEQHYVVLEARGARLRNVVPLHVTFDTSTLVRLFYNSGIFDGLAANKSTLLRDFMQHKDDIWKALFQTDARIFQSRAYAFDYMVRTDGVACSVLHARRGLDKGKWTLRRKRAKKK